MLNYKQIWHGIKFNFTIIYRKKAKSSYASKNKHNYGTLLINYYLFLCIPTYLHTHTHTHIYVKSCLAIFND